MSKTIKKKISELFKPENGNPKYTKSYCKEHTGDFIVYTGTTIGIFAKVDFADYTKPNLTFTTDGEKAGTIEYITDIGYCIGGHRTVLKPIVENIDLLYFKFILQPLFFKNVKRGDVPSLHFSNIKDLEVEIPVLSNGFFDLEKQRELSQQYQNIEMQKIILLNKIEGLKKSKILISADKTIRYQEVPITKLFTPKGGNMKLSKPYCKEHIGEYPVYSGSTTGDIFGSIDNYKYDGEYLTWVIDGLAGYVMKLSEKFSITCHRGILIPTKQCKNIDLLYVKYMIEPIFRKRARGRIGINGKNEYTALKPTHIINYNDSILIPVDESGEYDLETQKDLARKYATIETIKNNIYKQVKDLTDIIVE